jgi:hypothetical protein
MRETLKLQSSKLNGIFWSVLIDCLKKLGIPAEQIGQALLIVVTLVSPMLGSPLITQLKSRRGTTIPMIVAPCLRVVPADCYIDALKTPKLESKILSGTLDGGLNGKTVVSTDGQGLSPKITTYLHQNFLRREPPMGYLGALQENDPLREDPSVLLLNVDADTSQFSKFVNRPEDHTQKILALPADAQAIILQAHLKLLHSENSTFDIDFLERRL